MNYSDLTFLHPRGHLFDALTFFGVLLLICHTMGELLFKTKFIPRISGYIITGILLGPNVFNLINKSMLVDMRFFIDISVGLTLFVIGRYLDFKWLINDKGLLCTSLLEFFLTLFGIGGLVFFSGSSFIYALLAAIIISTTSPAIMVLITQDLNAVGPVSRRSLLIAATNNFLALSIFSLAFPFLKLQHAGVEYQIMYSCYRFLGSLFLGFISFKILEFLSLYIFPKRNQEQLILLIGILILASGLSQYLNLSIYLTLLSIGVATRNLDSDHGILDYNLELFTHIFFIPLFFITGCYLDFSGFIHTPLLILSCIGMRYMTKVSSVYAFRNLSFLTKQQAIYIGTALMPLSITAISITTIASDLNPELGSRLLAITSSCIGFFGIVGPIISQYVLLKSNEAFDNLKRV